MLLDVVRELAIAANVPVPATYVIEDGSQNAFATGRDPRHASLAITRGLLEQMDREQLQAIVGHELGHIRNLDTRHAVYVAVMVGLVALVTDGFLRVVVEGWRNGAFIWADGDNAAAGCVVGLLVGTFLLIVAGLLRLFAPLFALLVQAASSRNGSSWRMPRPSSSPGTPPAWSAPWRPWSATRTRWKPPTAAPNICGSATP